MKKILKLVALLLALFSWNQLDAQEQVYKDAVTLKNGSKLVGAVIDYQPGNKLIFELKNGKQVTLGPSQIKRIHMHGGESEAKVLSTERMKVKKIYNETETALLSGTSSLGASVSHTFLYQHSWRFAYGAGIGIDNYHLAPGRSIFPIYANGKVNLRNGKNSPFVGVKLGYGLAFENEEEDISEAKGGYMANPYFGIRLGSNGLIFNLYSGLKFQKVDYVILRGWETRREDILFRRLVVGMSVMF